MNNPIIVSGNDIGTHFFLYEYERIYKDEGEKTEELLGIQYKVQSTKNFATFCIVTGSQEIDIPEPEENQVVILDFEELRFFLWDVELCNCHVEGVADKVSAIKVFTLE